MASSSSIVAIPSRTSNGYVSQSSAYEQVVKGGTRDTCYVSEAIRVRYMSRTGWAHKTCTSYSRKFAPGHRYHDMNLWTVCDPSLVNNEITIEMFTYVMS